MFTAVLFTLAKTWKQLVSSDRWLDWEDVVYIHNGILLSHKKEWHNAICSNMDGARESHPEWNQPERQRQILYDIAYNWNLISSKNEHLLRKENHGLGEQTCGCLMGGGGSRREWEFEVNRCNLLPLEWMSNGILLYSTGNYIWSLMMEQDNVRKKNVYMYVYLGRKLTEHCKPAIMEKNKNH